MPLCRLFLKLTGNKKLNLQENLNPGVKQPLSHIKSTAGGVWLPNAWRWSAPGAVLSDDTVAEYIRCFSKPEAVIAELLAFFNPIHE